MKMFRRTFFVSLALFSAWAGSALGMRVTVISASGKTVYKGSTDRSGAFKTPTLPPGHYVVLWSATESTKGRYDLTIEGGKGTAIAEGVPGSKFSGGGVEVKVEVGPTAGSMSGSIAAAGTAGKATAAHSVAASAASTPIHPDGETKENGVRVKYEKGKKYVWFEPEMSTLGGHWVPADSREGRNVKGAKTFSAPGQDSDR
jgi:hypothetical protein